MKVSVNIDGDFLLYNIMIIIVVFVFVITSRINFDNNTYKISLILTNNILFGIMNETDSEKRN